MSKTYTELKEQYVALEKTHQYMEQTLPSGIDIAKKASRLIFMGCGSGYTISKSLATAAALETGIPTMSMAAGDVLLHAARYAKVFENAAVIFVTRSGSTSEIMLAVAELRKYTKNFKIITFACVKDSKAEEISDCTYVMPWAFDASVCQTRNVTNLYFAAMYFIADLAGDAELKKDLAATVQEGPAYMNRCEPELAKLADKPWTHAVTMADAELAGLCEEGALAFKEICQLPSNFYNILDSRHGPMVMIRPDSLVIIAMSDVKSKLERDLVSDVIKKGATVVLYSDMPAEIDGVINITFGKKLCQIARGVPFILICQLLSCYKAKEIGVDADNPDGLTPWIKI